MTRRVRTKQEARTIREQLMALIKDRFDNNGPVVTHDDLAKEHVRVNASVTAADDVHRYGGVAVFHLRRDEGYAIVPVTSLIHKWTGSPADEQEVADTVAGAGAGGPRVGWYHPTSADDWLWVFYLGHQAKIGTHVIYHTGQQMGGNAGLTTSTGMAKVNDLARPPLPAGGDEKKLLKADLARK